jgi:hypothetical protein
MLLSARQLSKRPRIGFKVKLQANFKVIKLLRCHSSKYRIFLSLSGIMAGGTRAIYSSVEGAEDSTIGGMEAVDNYGIKAGDVVIGWFMLDSNYV